MNEGELKKIPVQRDSTEIYKGFLPSNAPTRVMSPAGSKSSVTLVQPAMNTGRQPRTGEGGKATRASRGSRATDCGVAVFVNEG